MRVTARDGNHLRRGADEQLRRLMDHYFTNLGLPKNSDNVARFFALYDFFMKAVPAPERNAGRLGRLVSVTFGREDERGDGTEDDSQVTAQIVALSRQIAEERSLRQEEEALRKQVQADLNKVGGTVTNLYQELVEQIDRQRIALSEREQELAEQEVTARERLVSITGLESQLQTSLEKRLHDQAQNLLEAEVEELVSALGTIHAELMDIAQGAEEVEHDGGSDVPLLSVIRRLKREARAAGFDGLTGMRSRSSFNEAIERQLASWRRAVAEGSEQEHFSLLFLDIDHFKKVNDAHGHLSGDRVLERVGRVLKQLRRGTDTAYRFGGEEFVVLLPRTPVSGARNVAELVRNEIANLEITTLAGEKLRITASIGACDTRASGAAILHCADEALHRAKRDGRDRTVVFDEEGFLGPPPVGIPTGFVQEVRTRLSAEQSLAVVAVRAMDPEGETAIRERLTLCRKAPCIATDYGLFVLLSAVDGKAALDLVGGELGDLPIRAAATDSDEIPRATAAPPAARTYALLGQLVEMVR